MPGSITSKNQYWVWWGTTICYYISIRVMYYIFYSYFYCNFVISLIPLEFTFINCICTSVVLDFFVLIKALVWCGVRGQLPLCTTYYGIIVRDEIWVGEHKWGSKKKRQLYYTLMDLFCFPKWNNCYGLQKTNSKCSPWARVPPYLHKGLFLVMPTPHMPHSITELKQQNLSHDSFRLRGLPREYVKKQFAYVTTYLYGILYRKNVVSEYLGMFFCFVWRSINLNWPFSP